MVTFAEIGFELTSKLPPDPAKKPLRGVSSALFRSWYKTPAAAEVIVTGMTLPAQTDVVAGDTANKAEGNALTVTVWISKHVGTNETKSFVASQGKSLRPGLWNVVTPNPKSWLSIPCEAV